MENNEISPENAISEVAQQPKPRRGRPPKQKKVETRAQQTKTERRRRRNGDFQSAGKRMYVDPAIKDEENFSYRWVNEDPGRLHAFTTQDDWDFVEDPNMSEAMLARNGGADLENGDIGTRVSRVVGKNPDGSAKMAYLLKKPIEFFKEDKQKQQKQVDEIDQTMKRGQTPVNGIAGSGDAPLSGDETYSPAGGISIDDGTG